MMLWYKIKQPIPSSWKDFLQCFNCETTDLVCACHVCVFVQVSVFACLSVLVNERVCVSVCL